MRATTLMLMVCIGAILPGTAMLRAQVFERSGPVVRRAGGTVTIPYVTNDRMGNQIVFSQYGQFQHQGNTPVYSQGGMLQVNGSYPQMRSNAARIDDKTGEIIYENMPVQNAVLTRRILVNSEEGWIRYIDIIHNSQNQEQSFTLSLSASLNYGVQSSNTVADPKRKDQRIAWVAMTHANNRVAVEMVAGKGAKVVPTINYQQNNNAMQAVVPLTVPGGKDVAIMHFHHVTGSMEAGEKFVLGLNESKIMASIPPSIRRLIVNFRGGDNFIGDYELLRGDLMDVVELRTGDQLKGTIKDPSFKIQAFYGEVTLPADRVVAMINASQFKPRHLLVTKEGEIFGGVLRQEAMTLELSSGQTMQIPLSQISRAGYRKRPGEPEEWTFDKPIILMQSGERIGIQLPTFPIEAATRCGMLKLRPEVLSAINFQSEAHGVHDLLLTDGTHLTALVGADAFEMKLSGEGPVQTVNFPAANIRRLQFTSRGEEIDESRPVMKLNNDDMLVGAVGGSLKLDTAFGAITVNAAEIKRLAHAGNAGADVQVILWDDSSVSGQLEQTFLTCQLVCGVELKVPVVLVEEYVQPRPQPSAAVMESIKKLVGQLSADDWKQRDEAQDRLTTMGTVVVSTLRQLRDGLGPEAQQRADLILKQLDKGGADSTTRPAAATTPRPPMPAPMIEDQ